RYPPFACCSGALRHMADGNMPGGMCAENALTRDRPCPAEISAPRFWGMVDGFPQNSKAVQESKAYWVPSTTQLGIYLSCFDCMLARLLSTLNRRPWRFHPGRHIDVTAETQFTPASDGRPQGCFRVTFVRSEL